MQETSISWTDYSINLLKYRDAHGKIVWGCAKVSAGCTHCYSEALAKRWGRGKEFTAENMKSLTPFFDVEGARKLLRSKKVTGKKVFVSDMTDLFGEWVPDEIIDQHFAIFALRPDVTFQVLTKRAKRMRDYMIDYINGKRKIGSALGEMDSLATRLLVAKHGFGVEIGKRNGPPYGPPKHVHLGVSVEDQKNADERIRLLLETPAAVRWASVEPLLAPVNLSPYLTKFMDCGCYAAHTRLDGIVIGGESGSGHRELPIESAINLARDAHREGVSVFFKQDSGPRPGMKGRVLDDVWAMKDWPQVSQ